MATIQLHRLEEIMFEGEDGVDTSTWPRLTVTIPSPGVLSSITWNSKEIEQYLVELGKVQHAVHYWGKEALAYKDQKTDPISAGVLVRPAKHSLANCLLPFCVSSLKHTKGRQAGRRVPCDETQKEGGECPL